MQEQQKKIELTDKAKSLSDEGIVKNFADLKVSVSASLDKLGEQFVNEYKKFADLQQAIGIEKKNLEDLYELSANTDSLAAMLLAQKEQKEKFEEEMSARKNELEQGIKSEKEKFDAGIQEKRTQWKKEEEEQTLKSKEASDLLKKSRAREEQEYAYNLKTERKKEKDIYATTKLQLEKELAEKKSAFEKDFSERMAAIDSAEAELTHLRKNNEAFPAELEKAVAAAVKATGEKLKLEHKFETELKAIEVGGELKLKDQTIQALSAKIKEMEVALKEMSAKTVTAESSVKDIALKAIENSSKPYYYEKNRDNKTNE